MSIGVRPKRRLRGGRVRAGVRLAVALGLIVVVATGCAMPDHQAAGPSGSASSGQSPGVVPEDGQNDGSGLTKAPITPGGDLHGKVITVDPGHNGGNAAHPEVVNELVDVLTRKKACDTTGTETNDGYAEHAFNWDVAQRLATVLRARGAEVHLTRDSDDGVGPCITERTAIGNEVHSDVAVSIHADGGSSTGHGFHIMEPVLIKGHTDKILGPSQKLAVAIRDAYEKGTGLPPSNYIGEDGLNPRDDMGGLNLTKVPKVMVECGNMRNSGDAAKLRDPDFRQRIAVSLANGLAAFLSA